MREIIFRGKRVDNGEWVYGYLSKSRWINRQLELCIDYEEKGVMCSSIVIPETIGQYTGLKDNNGTRIFEGDIISKNYDESEIPFISCCVQFKYGEFELINHHSGKLLFISHACRGKIVGNIHDNPELIEEQDNESTL